MNSISIDSKIYLDELCLKESEVNQCLNCKGGSVKAWEYNEYSGYGAKARLFLCGNSDHETKAIIRHTYNSLKKEWIEESMYFDSDSFINLIMILSDS